MKIKELVIIALSLTISSYCIAQNISKSVKPKIEKNDESYKQKNDSLLNDIVYYQKQIDSSLREIKYSIKDENRYKLYATGQIYTFLRLDTESGKIMQVQWCLHPKDEFLVPINDVALKNYGVNNYELYPTTDEYQFILFSKHDGNIWHVQWSSIAKRRWIREITDIKESINK